MSVMDLIEHVNDLMNERLQEMKYVQATDIGLDRRAAYRLWVDDDCIVVKKSEDHNLQYYGGFEYVIKDYRTEVGDYVVYFADDERVRGHIDQLAEEAEE